MRPITELIIHCTATAPDWMAGKSTAAKVAEVKRWHVQDRKWRDIGYHYLIDRDGTVETGRALDQVGAHVQGHNTGTVGIALIGGHGSHERDQFGQHFTAAQDEALRELIADLRGRFPAIMRVTGHNQYAAKACPGFSVPEWLAAKPVPVSQPVAPSWLAGIIAAIAALFGGKK